MIVIFNDRLVLRKAEAEVQEVVDLLSRLSNEMLGCQGWAEGPGCFPEGLGFRV